MKSPSPLWSIGIDPGGTVGVALAEETVITRGMLTRLDKPKALTMVSFRDFSLARDTIFKLAAGRDLDRGILALEVVRAIYPKGDHRVGARMASSFLVGAEQVGALRELGRGLGLFVVEFPAERWRQSLTGSASPKDATIKTALAPMTAALGVQTNAHQRDALGVARHALIWARTPEGRAAREGGETWKATVRA